MPYFHIQYRDDYAAHQNHWFPGSFAPIEAADMASAVLAAEKAKPGIAVHSVTALADWTKADFKAASAPRKPRELKDPPRDSTGAVILWEDNNGELTCLAHAGAALTSAIESCPTARRHDTHIATYWKVPSGTGSGCGSCAADRRFNDALAKKAS